MEYSVVIPVYNSSKTIVQMAEEIDKLFRRLDKSYELILTDDCSSDDSFQIINRLASESPQIHAYQLKQNSGQMAATVCGIHHSKGEYIITMDDDFQYHPKEIEHLIAAMEGSEYDIVYGAPKERKQGKVPDTVVKLIILFFDYIVLPRYRSINFYTAFRIMRREVFFPNGTLNRERNLFFFWELPPERSKSIRVTHQPRKFGQSNQSVKSLLKLYKPQILYTLRIFFGIAGTTMVLAAIGTLLFTTSEVSRNVGLFATLALGFSICFVLLSANLHRFRRVHYEVK